MERVFLSHSMRKLGGWVSYSIIARKRLRLREERLGCSMRSRKFLLTISSMGRSSITVNAGFARIAFQFVSKTTTPGEQQYACQNDWDSETKQAPATGDLLRGVAKCKNNC